MDGKTNEINAFAPLLDRVDLAGVILTADALHTQTRRVDYLHRRDAHWILTLKANHPGLLKRLRALPWKQIPVADRSHGNGHGRLESRTVKVTGVAAGIGFPHARPAVQVTRRTRRGSGRWRTETVYAVTVYAVTDLDYDQISPAELADAIRAHWGIENRVHWVRDVTFAEDRPRSAPEQAPSSWPPCATSRSACTAWPERPTLPPPHDASADTPPTPSASSHNGSINNAGSW